MTAERIMTIREVGEYLKIDKSTIYRLLKRGGFPGWKLGSDWRFHQSAIDRWRFSQQTADSKRLPPA